MRLFRIFLLLCTLTVSGQCLSEASSELKTLPKTKEESWISKEVPLNFAKQLTFHSKILNESMPINIYLPSSFYEVSDDYRYPVIFINGSHGNQFFHTLTGIVKHLSELDRMPESIVVSLNYSGHFPKVFTNNMGWSRETINGYGQPEKYLMHLEQELFPFLTKNYRANQHRTLIGISGGAIFPFYSATNEPDLFQSYIFLAAMDVIGMGFDSKVTITDELAKAFSKDLAHPVFFYMGVADDDIQKKHSELYTNNLTNLEAKLAPLVSDNFRFKQEVIENERHYDAFMKVMLSALEAMYPEAIWAPKYRDLIAKPGDAMVNIDKYYAMLSQKVGFTVLPKPDRWNSVNCLRFIARKLLNDDRVKESITVAERWVSYQQNSAAAYAQLTKSYAADKQIDKAIKTGQKAVEIAKAKDDYRLADYQEVLAKLTSE